MERLKTKTIQDEKELSLVERILASEPDPKMAYILALDLILVGIDTVCIKHGLIATEKFHTQLSDINGSMFYFIPISNQA